MLESIVMDNKKGKIKNILVAIDFSENSDFAITRAIEITKKTNANLTFLHVVQKKSLDNFADNTLKKLLPKGLYLTTEEYKEELVQEKIRSLSRYKLNIEHVVIPKGNPAVKILQYARKNKADLLIMGAHGKYSIRDTFVGTTAEYIAQRTICPVLIVKKVPKKPYKKILVPIDFSNTSKAAFNYCLRLFPNASTRLIHVGDYEYEDILKKKENEELIPKSKIIKLRKAVLFYLDNKMKKFIKGHNKQLNKNSYNIQLGYPGSVIINESTKLNCDLIIMGTQGHGRLHYLFIGSVANWVLTETDKDILLIPSK
jgi:nucleotide-binding universal stress UspA family protein